MDTSLRERPSWVTAEAVRSRDTLWLSKKSENTAWAVDTVRAVLTEDAICAWDEFCILVDDGRPAAEHFHRWAKANPSRAAKTMQDSAKIDIFLSTGPPFPADGVFTFSERWLFGSSVGANIVSSFVYFVAMDVDLIAVDQERLDDPGPSAVMYGPRTREQNRMRVDAHAAGLHPRKSQNRWDTCRAWVVCYHVFDGPADWLRSGESEYLNEDNTSRQFAPIHSTLHISSGPGRPTTRTIQ